MKKSEAEAVEQRRVLDVVGGEVREDAGFHIALVVDVDVLAPAGQATAGEGAVAPEVGHEERPGVADVHDTAAQLVALLRAAA